MKIEVHLQHDFKELKCFSSEQLLFQALCMATDVAMPTTRKKDTTAKTVKSITFHINH